jgi:hypothetical protein
MKPVVNAKAKNADAPTIDPNKMPAVSNAMKISVIATNQ